MNPVLRQRLFGTAVLCALLVIFVPMLFEETDRAVVDPSTAVQDLPLPNPPADLSAARPPPVVPAPLATIELPPPAATAHKPSSAGDDDLDIVSSSDFAPPMDMEPPGTVASNTLLPSEPVDPNLAEPPTLPSRSAPATKKPTATPTKPKPKPQPKATAPSAYVVQLGSFNEEKNAAALRDQLRKANIAAFVETTTGARAHFRVLAGPELDRKRAQEVLARIKAEFKVNGFITTYPSKSTTAE